MTKFYLRFSDENKQNVSQYNKDDTYVSLDKHPNINIVYVAHPNLIKPCI